MGLALKNGQGIQVDEVEAAYWFLKANEQGWLQAKEEFEKLTVYAQSKGQQRFDGEKPTTQLFVSIPAAMPISAPDSSTAKPLPLVASNSSTAQTSVNSGKLQSDVVYANRKALVIGNDSYKTVTKLLTAREDAKSIAAGLTRVGYQVTLKTDLDRQGMNAAIRNFKSQVEGGDEIAIFYAGHGVQLSNTNFLLPIDISGETEEQLKDDAVPLQRLLDDIADKHAKFTLALIDACRDNPFKASNGRSIGGTRGLSPTTAATGQMIVFSAGTGQQALDKLGPNDKDKNGVFTRVLLKQLDTQGVSIDKLVRNVRMEVVGLAKSVGHEQVPAIYDQVVGDFYFRK